MTVNPEVVLCSACEVEFPVSSPPPEGPGPGKLPQTPFSGTTTANWDCRWQDYFRLSRPSRSDLWKAAHPKIVSEPEDNPWKLREFMVTDLDGNLIRVFYDFRDEM